MVQVPERLGLHVTSGGVPVHMFVIGAHGTTSRLQLMPSQTKLEMRCESAQRGNPPEGGLHVVLVGSGVAGAHPPQEHFPLGSAQAKLPVHDLSPKQVEQSTTSISFFWTHFNPSTSNDSPHFAHAAGA